MNVALYDQMISVYPQPELPPDNELRQISVSIWYALPTEVEPHQMASPYCGELAFQITGDLVTVASWLDEHVQPFADVMGGSTYVQGAATPGFKRQLLKGGNQEFGGIMFTVNREIPQHLR